MFFYEIPLLNKDYDISLNREKLNIFCRKPVENRVG
jgi:hypothetical protein